MKKNDTITEISWDTQVPLLTNPFLLYDAVKAVIISAVIFLALIGTFCVFLDDYEPLTGLIKLMGYVAPGILVFLALICLIIFPRGFPARFWITQKGVSWDFTTSLRGAAAANPLSPASANATGILKWKEIKSFHEHPSRHIICLRNGWRVVVRLYCKPENYEDCVAIIRAKYINNNFSKS